MNCLHLGENLKAKWIEKATMNPLKTINKPFQINFTTNVNCYEDQPNNKCKITWLSFLQSNLQKSIRRNKKKVAVNTAKEMTLYYGGWTKLIRRLGIIVIEDKLAGLDLHYSTLIWLTAVAPFRNKELEQWVFNYVLFLCDQTFKELTTIDRAKEAKSQISKSIKLRSFYGGMKGDMNLLKTAIHHYSETKFLDLKSLPLAKTKPLKHLLWYAADFHCFPDILNLLSMEFGYSKEELKKIIWFNSSGLRKGVSTKKYKKEVWDKIKNKMIDLAIIKIKECIPEDDPLLK